MHRLFIALNLSIPVVETLVMLQRDLEERVEEEHGDEVRLRTVDAANIHLTLKFIGDTPPEMVAPICERLDEMCEPLFCFEIECRQLGAFPDLGTPRVIWAGLDEETGEVLSLLQRNLEQELAQIGIEEDSRPFHPHVTLARVKSRRRPSLRSLAEEYEEVTFGKTFIKDIVLYESHLDPDGARYEVVERFSLGGG